MTNAERLRQMNEDELVEWLIGSECVVDNEKCKVCEIGSFNCDECIREWLEREVDE